MLSLLAEKLTTNQFGEVLFIIWHLHLSVIWGYYSLDPSDHAGFLLFQYR